MIIKRREYPIEIQALKALQGRLLDTHKKWDAIKEELAIRNAGYYGEKQVDYLTSLLPSGKFHIFENLRLPNKNTFFQIDTLLISLNYILILETKHIKGELYFDSYHHQFIRKYKGQEERFTEPILQARRSALQLKEWLKNNRMPNVPITYLFVNSNPTAIFKFPDNSHPYHDKIIHAEYLIDKIAQLDEIYTSPHISSKQLRVFDSRLLSYHTPKNIDVMKDFSIKKEDLLKGVHCLNCGTLPMYRKNRTWECQTCHTRSSTAHINALNDYFLLIAPHITNKECREFLLLSSRRVAQIILKSLNLSTEGNTKGRIYYKSETPTPLPHMLK